MASRRRIRRHEDDRRGAIALEGEVRGVVAPLRQFGSKNETVAMVTISSVVALLPAASLQQPKVATR
jgi:hypothetical protein